MNRVGWVLVLALMLTACGDDSRPTAVSTLTVDPPSADELVARQIAALHDAARAARAEGRGADAERIFRNVLELDPDDGAARAALGFTDFDTEVLRRADVVDPIPDAIAYRAHPFLDEVVAFHEKRWLTDPEEIERAGEVVRLMGEHDRRLVEDREYRAVEQMRANLAFDPDIGDLLQATRWVRPFLLCAVAPPREGVPEARQIAELETLLDQPARLLPQLHQEFRRRYGDPLDLPDLMDPYGGRPDLPLGVKSFKDGVVLPVVVFADVETYEAKLHGGYQLGTFLGRVTHEGTTWVVARLADGPYALLWCAARQLLGWHARQLNRWAPAWTSRGWLDYGPAYDLASMQLGGDDELVYTGVHLQLMKAAQAVQDGLAERELTYPYLGLEKLVASSGFPSLAGEYPDVPPVVLSAAFHQQSWALFRYLLDEQPEGMRALVHRALEERRFSLRPHEIQDALGLSPADWQALSSNFETWFRQMVLDGALRPR